MTQPILSDERTLAYYDQNAARYAERPPHQKDRVALKQFLRLLPRDASVCDLGCGSGWAAAAMAENGLRVHAIDGSAGLAAQAQHKHNVSVDVATFDEFRVRHAYDGIWAGWSLHHVPRGSFPELLHRVSAAVRPGGLFFFSVKGGTAQGRDQLDRFYAYHSWPELQQIIEANVAGTVIAQTSWTDHCFAGVLTQLHHVLIRMSGT